jgi:CxxC-x17-CxxC domain-containing protein
MSTPVNEHTGTEPVRFSNRTMTCLDCKAPFIWTAGEQTFFRDKGFTHEPKRCQACRAQRKERGQATSEPARAESAQRQRVETSVNCERCGTRTTVPFVPTGARPVYCRPCFQAMS